MDTTDDAKKEEHLTSALGTKQFWDERYCLELKNFLEYNDEGEVWFGRSAENRLISYLTKAGTSLNARIIDLGCGNGSLLRRLKCKGFHCLTGVDYCADAITLATSLSKGETKNDEEASNNISFKVVDLLDPNMNLSLYDVVMDKGTWDAMSLSEDCDRRLLLYRTLISQILDDHGIFIIFSCNFTRDELCKRFGMLPLRYETEIAAEHSFTFGGKTGLTSTGVVFKKVVE
uniref:Protein-lysine N-methyltransferase n=1 Tax=Syphacia muris TaxID=451379 RepID=A0A0N5APZ8_9BILA